MPREQQDVEGRSLNLIVSITEPCGEISAGRKNRPVTKALSGWSSAFGCLEDLKQNCCVLKYLTGKRSLSFFEVEVTLS